MNRDRRNQTTSLRTTFHESKRFVDYLHGDIRPQEGWFACYYEFARESNALWTAADKRDKIVKARHCKPATAVAQVASQVTPWAWCFLCCASFPRKDWNELTPHERNEITRLYQTKKRPPLPVMDAWTLLALARERTLRRKLLKTVLERIEKLARESEPHVIDVPPGSSAPPYNPLPALLQLNESVYLVAFEADYSKSGNDLKEQFGAWLKTPENQQLLKKHKKPVTGATGLYVDRLKDLAAWRLYREFGNDWCRANDFAKERRKKFTLLEIHERYKTKEERKQFKPGDPRPFHSAKPLKEKQTTGQLVSIPANQANLFRTDDEARKAKQRALQFLREIMPQEFRQFPLRPSDEEEIRSFF